MSKEKNTVTYEELPDFLKQNGEDTMKNSKKLRYSEEFLQEYERQYEAKIAELNKKICERDEKFKELLRRNGKLPKKN